MTDFEFKTYYNCNRVIKFRWWTSDKIMTFDNWGFNEEVTINDMFEFNKEYGHVCMEYVGVSDSEGNDIYEGDILCKEIGTHKLLTYYVVVKYIASFCTIGLYQNTNKPNPRPKEANLSFWGKTKIVGNIHQNPELLLKKPQ